MTVSLVIFILSLGALTGAVITAGIGRADNERLRRIIAELSDQLTAAHRRNDANQVLIDALWEEA